ncbi:MAG: hypothetical protein DRK00_01105 [Thermoprotei archaeon]|nr:MAG: hypothetical protein DRK00_01105 [Thermoprotei archaeon]
MPVAGGPYPIEIIVAEILAIVEDTRLSLRAVMEDYFKRKPHLQSAKSLARAYAAGVLRSFKLVDEIAHCILGLNMSQLDSFSRNALRALIYEAKFRRVDKERILGLARRLRLRLGPRELSLIREVNLEDLAKRRDEISKLALMYSQPEWVVEYLLKLLGRNEAEKLLKAFNRTPTTWLRVNTLKVSVDELEKKLRRRGLVVVRDDDLPYMLKVLKARIPPSQVPEHSKGMFYIQDKASALAVQCLGEAELIADLTAAPGGKASLAHQLWGSEVLALELRRKRALIMKRLLERLDILGVHIINADSAHPPLRVKFKKVIVDPDCSSLGRLGHSPEIRLWIKPSMMLKYAAEQRRLIKAAYSLLERGGELVYSTCTFTLEENEENILWALNVLGLELEETRPRIGLPGLMGLEEAQRLYPHLHDTVGFFIAKLRKP